MHKLKEVGMHWLQVSLEHGNEDFRKTHLKRGYTNESVEKAITILKEEIFRLSKPKRGKPQPRKKRYYRPRKPSNKSSK